MAPSEATPAAAFNWPVDGRFLPATPSAAVSRTGKGEIDDDAATPLDYRCGNSPRRVSIVAAGAASAKRTSGLVRRLDGWGRCLGKKPQAWRSDPADAGREEDHGCSAIDRRS